MLTSTSSFGKEEKFVNATRADMALYGQTFSNYFCISRKSKVKFDEAISLAVNKLSSVILIKHGGYLEGVDGEKMTNKQLLNGSSNLILETAFLTCPDQVPDKYARKIRKTIEERQKSIDQENNNN